MLWQRQGMLTESDRRTAIKPFPVWEIRAMNCRLGKKEILHGKGFEMAEESVWQYKNKANLHHFERRGKHVRRTPGFQTGAFNWFHAR